MKKQYYKEHPDREQSRGMGLNRITLSFRGDQEEVYMEKYFQDSLTQFRVSFFLVTLIYETFGFLDSRIDQHFVGLFHLIRYGVVLPGLSAVLLLSFTGFFRKIWQEAIFAGLLIGGFAGAVLTLKAADNYAYYAGMMIIFSTGYFFIKLRFFLASLAGWIILLFFNVCALTFAPVGSEMLLINDFFFIATNLIGMFAAYNIEYYTRRDFFLNRQLDARNAEIVEANKTLESKVAVRTAELVLAKDRAEESDRLKSAFLANMSHEIRTPMNGILGFAGLLKEQDLTGEEQQHYVRIIEKSGQRLLNTINDIVDISKIEAGQTEVVLAETNINMQMAFIHSFFSPEVKEKGVIFTYRNGLGDDRAVIRSDSEKIYAILTNLVKNAIKYTEQGYIEFGYRVNAMVPVSGNVVPAELEFFVKDTGIGIPENRQDAIFERFIQADIEDSRAMQGSGLGLAISKAYVEMLGGAIRVESQPGLGSAFYFTIPCNPDNHHDINREGTVVLQQT
ncbi:MAG: ATP-binding protein [Bacteroidota bacterium]